MSEYCDISRVIIKKAKKDEVYNIVAKKHYSKTWTASQCIYAIYWDTQEEHSFFEDTKVKLIGAVLYGHPVGFRVVKSISDKLNDGDVMELKRLWIEDGYGKNIESYCISQTLKMVKQDTDTKVVISYADPGSNHKGIIYRASNWLYQGNEIGAADAYMYRYPNTEKWLSDRAIGEQLGTNGLGGVLKKVPDMEYKKKLRKHRYIYFLCNNRERKKFVSSLKHPLVNYE